MTFQRRLKIVCQKGNLTVSDLARWFRAPRPTVRGWLEKGHAPRGGPQDIAHIEALLALAETLIQKQKFLPIPKLVGRKRIQYLEDIRETLLPARAR